MKRISILIGFVLLLNVNLFSQENQQTVRIFEVHGQTVFLSTVGMRLIDSRTTEGDCYDNNEDYYVTFYDTACFYPNRLTTVVDELDIHPSDTLYIYDGPDTTYPLLFKGNNSNASSVRYDDIYSTDNVLTIRIKTDSADTAGGFSFNIVCKKICQEMEMSWDTAFYKYSGGEPLERKVTWDFEVKEVNDSVTGAFLRMDTIWFHAFDICFGDTMGVALNVEFPENDMYYHQDEESVYYTWKFGDGDSVSGLMLSEVRHKYAMGKGYTVYVQTMDNRGCKSKQFLPARVRIANSPIRTVNNFPSVCYNANKSTSDSVMLDNSVIHIEAMEFGAEVASEFNTRVFIPDGPECTDRCYYSSVYFTEFPTGKTVESAEDICSICINMEHEFMGDISIALICPEGNRAVLKYKEEEYVDPNTGEVDFPGGGGDGNFFGLPYGGIGHHRYNHATNECDSLYNIPGVGWNYCWSYNDDYGYWDRTGNPNSNLNNAIYVNNNLVPVTHDFGSHLPSGYYITENAPGEQMFSTTDSSYKSQKIGFYKPSENFASLVGCSLNGRWDVEICDLWGSDNGWVFSWELEFCNMSDEDWGYIVGIDTIMWTERSENIMFDRETGSVSVNDTFGTFFLDVTVVDSFDCVWDTTVSITSIWIPIPELGLDTFFCSDERTVLNASDGYANQNNYSYYWEPTGDTTQCIWTDKSRLGSTLYEVEVTNTMGFDNKKCIGRDSILVTINPMYNDTIFAEICGGEVFDSVGFYETESTTITRYFSTEAGCDSLVTLNLTVFPSYNDTIHATIRENEYYNEYGFMETMEGVYTKQLITIDGCDSIVVLDLTLEGFDDLFIPNVFTPRSDINNLFTIKHGSLLTIKNVLIYNRWGELVFESENNATAWDGKYKGSYCEQEVYTYLVRYCNVNTPNEIKSKIGTVLLLY